MQNNTKNKKILILVPSYTARGGISNYFKTLEGKFTYDVEYFIRGARNWPFRKNIISEFSRACKDLINYYRLINKDTFSLVITSTSTGKFALVRDSLFILLAKKQKIKVIIFFRGWKDSLIEKIEKRAFKIFRYLLNNSDALIFLAKRFKEKALSWGYSNPIYVETTVVDESLLKGFNKEEFLKKYKKANEINILFLGRIELNKGIYEAIDTFKMLSLKYSNLNFFIAGDGTEEEKMKNYIKKKKLDNVSILGFIQNEKKREVYRNSHIYFFPSHREGMPTSVLEAMAMGLPVVTRDVGGVSDFFSNNENGFITRTKSPKKFAELLEKLINNLSLMSKIAERNYEYAKKNFVSSVVIKRLENIIKRTLECV